MVYAPHNSSSFHQGASGLMVVTVEVPNLILDGDIF